MKRSDKRIREAVLEDLSVATNLEHLIQDLIEYPGQSHKPEVTMFLLALEAAVEKNREEDDEYVNDDSRCGL